MERERGHRPVELTVERASLLIFIGVFIGACVTFFVDLIGAAC